MTGEELRKLRMRCGLERKEVVFSSGYSYQSWKEWECGYSPVPDRVVAWLRTIQEQQELIAECSRLRQENEALRNRIRADYRRGK